MAILYNQKFVIVNSNTFLTSWEIFKRIEEIFANGWLKDELDIQKFSFRDGVVAEFNKTIDGYNIVFSTDLRYKEKKNCIRGEY